MYEEFLENERKLCKRFLENQHVYDDRFIENEYAVVRKMFENEGMILKVYEIVEDLIKKEGYISKHTVVGDFLFSMCSFDMSDPAFVIAKINKNEYLKNISIRADINRLFGYDYYKYVDIHKRLLLGLRGNNVIRGDVIRKFNVEWYSISYLKMNMSGLNIENIIPI